MNIIESYLTPNPYSRPQRKLLAVNGIVVHWVANPNSSAKANRDFFENRKLGNTGYGSAHDIIDLNGDLYQCVPYDEEAYQVGSNIPYKEGSAQIYTPMAWEKLNQNENKNIQPYPNCLVIGVECTHIDWDGTMTPETEETLLLWCVERLMENNLTVDDLYLHKEIVGWKNCHYYFVKNPDKWIEFKQDVDFVMKNGGTRMIKELQSQVQALTEEVKKLKEYNAMPSIPSWASEAINSAVSQKIMDSPENRSYDLYAILTILHRKGVI